MHDPIAFVLASLSLLFLPGPTNTLLATSGACVGARRSLRLVPAELAGYLTSIAALTQLLGPVVAARPALQRGLRATCAVALLVIAWRLFRTDEREAAAGEAVTVRSLFLTTLVNPKALVFSFVILPYTASGDLRHALPYVAALTAFILAAGCTWIALGALLHAKARAFAQGRGFRRFASAVLVVFATLVSISALRA